MTILTPSALCLSSVKKEHYCQVECHLSYISILTESEFTVMSIVFNLLFSIYTEIESK